jgi:acetyl-CoA synthetase (ADP-forming)/acetyltransferase
LTDVNFNDIKISLIFVFQDEFIMTKESIMIEKENHPLDVLFYPKSVAMIASVKPHAPGNRWITTYTNLGYSGKIYPVNANAGDSLGHKTYASVLDLPGPVDLALFGIPSHAVLPVLRDCGKKGVQFAHFFTAGFSETGEAKDEALEKELVDTARQYNIRILGPNCMGVYCPEGHVGWMEHFPKEPGPVGFISQSGQLAGMFVNLGASEGLRFSKVVSYGNASDLQVHDFINYMAEDEKTKVIGMYIEGFKDGRAFFEAVKNTTRKKPLVIFKGGQTEGGARATQSHTASIAGSAKIWEALCKQTGIISVNSMEELIGTALAFLKLKLPGGNRAAILGGAGGGSVTMTDMAEKEGLSVPHLSEETIRELQKIVPAQGTSVKNPLDVGFSSIYQEESQFLRMYELLEADPKIDAVIFSRAIMPGNNGVAKFIELNIKGMDVLSKPVFTVVPASNSLERETARHEAQAMYEKAGISTFASFPLAARVMNNLYQYGCFLQHP